MQKQEKEEKDLDEKKEKKEKEKEQEQKQEQKQEQQKVKEVNNIRNMFVTVPVQRYDGQKENKRLQKPEKRKET